MRLDRNFWLKLAFDSGLIVFSVLLALALNEYMSANREKEKTRQTLLSIRQELQTNHDNLSNWHLIHQKALAQIIHYRARPALHDSLSLNNQFRLGLLFEGTLLPSTMRSNAWETAINTGQLQNFDLALAHTLSEIYEMQRTGVERSADRLLALIFERQTHDAARVAQTLGILELNMQELIGQESYLLGAYKEVIQTLDGAIKQ
jgi:hypothetical protein